MYRRQLVKRIVKELEKGKTIDAVKNDLRAEGWSLKDIADASYYSTYPEKLRHFSVTRFLDTEVHLYITIVLIGISIFFMGQSWRSPTRRFFKKQKKNFPTPKLILSKSTFRK